MEKVNVPAAPGRLINAIANMGYDHEVALCDLIDNSIDANATTVKVYLPSKRNEGGRKDTIYQYLLADDGNGMDKQTLINAFTLGSVREYPKHALGKFGIGLKSAGLSLGSKIIVVTKLENMETPLCGILSRQEIERTGDYTIDLGDSPAPYHELWERHAPNKEHGTVLLIEELNTPRFKDFIDYFRRYCGIVYHMFLEDKTQPFSITVEDTQTSIIEDTKVKPIDPLFLEEATATKETFNPETWDGKTPHLLLAPYQLALGDDKICEIAATHLIHSPSFAKDGKQAEMRERYCIDKDPYTQKNRHGFYIYRNRRIIVMAELFRGIISSETAAWAFRGRLMFDENADTILSLDVKKRHCQLPSEPRANLDNIISPYQTKSITAWKEIGKKVTQKRKDEKEDIAQQSVTKTPVANLDYSPGITLETQEAIDKRKERQEEVRKEVLELIQDKDITEQVLEQKAKDKSVVVPVKGMKANRMWEVYPATNVGVSETLINEYHSWIRNAYAEAEVEPRIMIILHQLFTILARAELEVKTNQWEGLTTTIVERVFDLFRRKASAFAEDLAETLEEELKKLDSRQSESE